MASSRSTMCGAPGAGGGDALCSQSRRFCRRRQSVSPALGWVEKWKGGSHGLAPTTMRPRSDRGALDRLLSPLGSVARRRQTPVCRSSPRWEADALLGYIGSGVRVEVEIRLFPQPRDARLRTHRISRTPPRSAAPCDRDAHRESRVRFRATISSRRSSAPTACPSVRATFAVRNSGPLAGT